MKPYIIYYEVDNGCYYDKDMAIVFASNESEAVLLLKKHIDSIGCSYSYRVSNIYWAKEFHGTVFTRLFEHTDA